MVLAQAGIQVVLDNVIGCFPVEGIQFVEEFFIFAVEVWKFLLFYL